jgi:hypothetical protein
MPVSQKPSSRGRKVLVPVVELQRWAEDNAEEILPCR